MKRNLSEKCCTIKVSRITDILTDIDINIVSKIADRLTDIDHNKEQNNEYFD